MIKRVVDSVRKRGVFWTIRLAGRKVKKSVLGGKPPSYVPYEKRGDLYQSQFKENMGRIFQGEVPYRYKNIASKVPGRRVLEIGSAEGVLSLTLARRKDKVCGMELTDFRYETACKLKSQWEAMGYSVENCTLLKGDILARPDIMVDFDTLVAVRVIYHLREKVHQLFERIPENIEHVFLCGNRDKESSVHQAGNLDELSNVHSLGKWIYYASQKGMEEILEAHGFDIIESYQATEDDDPIVVGQRRR